MDFIDRIDEKLKEKQLKRLTLCDELGITHSAISDWKRRNTIPAADVCLKIADYLDVSVEWLVTGKEKTAPQYTKEEQNLLRKYNDLTDGQKRSVEILIDGYTEDNYELLKKVSV